MSKYYLINSLRIGQHRLLAGTVLDDVVDVRTYNRAVSAGAVLGPFADATLTAAAAEALARSRQGASEGDLELIMQSALNKAQGMTSLPHAPLTALIQKLAVSLDFTEMTGLGAGVKTFTKALGAGAALPANCRFLGVTLGSPTFTGFDDAAHGTYTLEVGNQTVGAIADVVTATSVAAGATGFPKSGTISAKAFPGGPAALPAGGVPSIKLTSSVDLLGLTAGHVDVDILYVVTGITG